MISDVPYPCTGYERELGVGVGLTRRGKFLAEFALYARGVAGAIKPITTGPTTTATSKGYAGILG